VETYYHDQFAAGYETGGSSRHPAARSLCQIKDLLAERKMNELLSDGWRVCAQQPHLYSRTQCRRAEPLSEPPTEPPTEPLTEPPAEPVPTRAPAHSLEALPSLLHFQPGWIQPARLATSLPIPFKQMVRRPLVAR